MIGIPAKRGYQYQPETSRFSEVEARQKKGPSSDIRTLETP
jgi:hypothetical protein